MEKKDMIWKIKNDRNGLYLMAVIILCWVLTIANITDNTDKKIDKLSNQIDSLRTELKSGK